jgi:hypothetical protein
MPLSAHQFPDMYQDLGYDLAKLGCIMLEVEPILKSTFPPEHLYYAKDPKHFWIKGFVADKPHVTLLYGLLRSGPEMKKHVDAVLEGWDMTTVEIENVGMFESPYPEEEYGCIVAHLRITRELQEAHDRLTFLPHINTFPGYKAHVTLAYVKSEFAQKYVETLKNLLIGLPLATRGLDYGGNH